MTIGRVLERFIDDLSSKGVDRSTIISCNYHPPRDCDATIICDGSNTDELLVAARSLYYVQSAERINRFINLSFRDCIVELASADSISISKTATVEHTSLSAVFPLSVGVYRLSVIGEWMRRSLDYLGYSVSARVWIQDNARHVDLVREAVRSKRMVAKKGEFGKGDHTIGRIFVEELLSREGVDRKQARTIAAEMFPLGLSAVRRPMYGDWIKDVLMGWRSTFNLSGIRIDHFDRQMDVTKIDWRAIIERALAMNYRSRPPEGFAAPEKLGYSWWCVLYYCYLLRQADKCFSVVQSRQTHLLTKAKKVACAIECRDPSDLTLVPVGDVRIAQKLDRIKEFRFTTVDDLQQYADRDVGSLVERFLTTRASTNLNIEFPIVPIESYPNVHQTNRSRIVRAVMLLDELPGILQAALSTGDFAMTTQWSARAMIVRRELASSHPKVTKDLQNATELFSPFTSNIRR